jgi:F-type H+-transporting ATPase subunit delta
MNADLIGGFVIEMDDKLYDASIRKELNDIKNQFTNNSYISKI